MRASDRASVARIARDSRAEGKRLVEIGECLQREADELERSLAGGEVEVLRGRQSTDTLATLTEVGDEFHYHDLLGILRGAGYSVAGADPAASLLASLARCSEFVVTAPRTGIYRRVA